MSIRVPTLSLLALLTLAPGIAAQAPVVPRSPYAGRQARAIKALSEEDVRALYEGEGMGYALAAELNGWPGPRHVLDLADGLALTGDQRARIGPIHDRMKDRARALGAEIVEREAALDRAFAEGALDESGLRERVAEIARWAGELRATHLVAHLETRAVLTARQVARYDRLRGYGGDAEDHAGHRH